MKRKKAQASVAEIVLCKNTLQFDQLSSWNYKLDLVM